jgi:hypothetical protein
MVNPDDDKTIINVKGVPKPAWELAKRLAAQADEPMGMLLARAIQCLADQEAGRVKPPDKKVTKQGNPPLTPAQLTDRITALAMLSQANAANRQARARIAKDSTLGIGLALLQQAMIDAEGEPPTTLPGKAARQAAGNPGQSIASGHAARYGDPANVASQAAAQPIAATARRVVQGFENNA